MTQINSFAMTKKSGNMLKCDDIFLNKLHISENIEH